MASISRLRYCYYLYGVCPLVATNNLWAIDVFYFIYKTIIPRLDIFVNKNYNYLFIYFYEQNYNWDFKSQLRKKKSRSLAKQIKLAELRFYLYYILDL